MMDSQVMPGGCSSPPGGALAERSPPLSPRVAAARAWATELHAGQTRKGSGIPYIGHPLAVAALVALDGGSEAQQIGALLHDAIEDCGITAEQIAERFGPEVAAIVEACSDCGPTTRGGRKPPWRQRKLGTIEGLPAKLPTSWLVTAADKADNARSTVADARAGRLSWGIFKTGMRGCLWYSQAMHEGLAALLPTSRSVQLLGDALAELLSLPEVVAAAAGEDPADWARRFTEHQLQPA